MLTENSSCFLNGPISYAYHTVDQD